MTDVFMPRLSDTMEEGTIAEWLVAEGDEVERGAVLAQIETDKAVMDLEAYDSGVLEKIVIGPGETVPIGEQIAIIGDGSGAAAAAGANGSGAGAGFSAAAAADTGSDSGAGDARADKTSGNDDAPAGTAATPAGAAEPASAADPAEATESAPASDPDHVLKASPVVRSLARTHGLDLSTVTGTGPGGRIIRVDVEKLIASGGAQSGTASSAPSPTAAAATAAPAAPASAGSTQAADERIPLSQIRKVTAKRLSEAALVPAFQLTSVVDVTELGALRKQINANLAETGVKISVTDLLVRACAVTLRAHPEVNAAFDGDAIIRRGAVNVGIAVAIDDGLLVPVVTDADKKSLSEIGTEAKDLAKRARAGKLSPNEFSGGTFTISNLGMFGIDNFTAVLNPPEAAILAVGSTQDEPVVVDGEVQVRARTRLTLTVDHRVLDGAMGAAFLQDLTTLLENPLRILV